MLLDEKQTLIVDGMNLAFRWKHQGRTDFRYDFKMTIESLAQSYECSNIIVTADQGSSEYRKNIYPEYKQNRKDKFAEQTEEEKMAFEAFFEEYEAALELIAEDYLVLRYKGVEADDLAAYLVKHKDRLELGRIWLISSDRDWDLLVQDDVSRFSYVTRKEVTAKNWYDHYDIDREFYISQKVLTGDKGDNIYGIPGIGDKRAYQLITDYGDGLDIYESLPLPGKQKFVQALNESGDLILKNYELMDLLAYCEDAIGGDNRQDIERRLNEH
jgi:5'-3' exonuclease